MSISSISSNPPSTLKPPSVPKYMAAGPVSPVVETSILRNFSKLDGPLRGFQWSCQIQNFMSSPQCYGWWLKSCISWGWENPPLFYRVLYIPAGAGFLPSTVSSLAWVVSRCLTTFSYLERVCLFLLPARQVTILMKQLRDSYLLELRRSSPWQCEPKSQKTCPKHRVCHNPLKQP